MDLEAVLARLGGDRGLLAELATIYLEDEAAQIAAVAEAVEGGDAERVRRAAHAIKGSVANFGAGRAHAAALAMEMAGRNGDLSCAPALLGTLRRELAALHAALTALAEPSPSGM
jgi:HPt (histidine-containing phosphotransfer) domain-containing protein